MPLDIAALGLTAVVLSFAKTLQNVIEIYTRPLFLIINKRVTDIGHAVIFTVGNGFAALIYMMSGNSLIAIFIAVSILGLLKGAGGFSQKKAFRDHEDLKRHSRIRETYSTETLAEVWQRCHSSIDGCLQQWSSAPSSRYRLANSLLV